MLLNNFIIKYFLWVCCGCKLYTGAITAGVTAAATIASTAMSMTAGGEGADAAMANADMVSQQQMDELRRSRDSANRYQMPYYNTGTAGQNELAYRLGLTNQFQTARDTSITAFKATMKQKMADLMKSRPDPKKDKKGFEKWKAQKNWVSEQMKGDVNSDSYKAWVDRQPATTTTTRPIDDKYGSLLDGKFNFEADPGYQFRLDQGNQALDRRLAQQGLTNSGSALKAGMRFNQGEANQTFNDAWQRWMENKKYQTGALEHIAGTGQRAAEQIGNNEANYGQNVSSVLQNKGVYQNQAINDKTNSKLAGIQGIGNAVNDTVGNLYSIYKNNQIKSPKTITV